MFTAAERPGSIVRPMQLNRAPYGSMRDGAIGLMDLSIAHCPFVADGEWKTESLRYSGDQGWGKIGTAIFVTKTDRFISEHGSMGKDWIQLGVGPLGFHCVCGDYICVMDIYMTFLVADIPIDVEI